eukprot:62269-Chlamydomonas_euryale.AAC.6
MTPWLDHPTCDKVERSSLHLPHTHTHSVSPGCKFFASVNTIVWYVVQECLSSAACQARGLAQPAAR